MVPPAPPPPFDGPLLAFVALSILATCFSSFFYPAIGALIPSLVEDESELGPANSAWASLDNFAFVIGPAPAGSPLRPGAEARRWARSRQGACGGGGEGARARVGVRSASQRCPPVRRYRHRELGGLPRLLRGEQLHRGEREPRHT